MLFFAGWAVLSLAWAEDTALTFRRLVVFAILCLAAAAIARRYSLREIVLLTFFCSILFLLIGVSAEILLGTFRPFAPGYRFAGTLHPNHQGINCALLLLSGVAAADTEKRGRMLFRACALLGLVFLILTASRTTFAAAMLALALYLAAVSSRWAKTALGLGLGIAFCVLLHGSWECDCFQTSRAPLCSEGMTPTLTRSTVAPRFGRSAATTSNNVQFLVTAMAASGPKTTSRRFRLRKSGEWLRVILPTSIASSTLG